MKKTTTLITLLAATPLLADETRQLDAHEHGVGTLGIAIEGTTVGMEFHAPGADIVGFEYAAESEAEISMIEAAIATLSAPMDLFVLPDAAGCSVVDAHAELESEDGHGDAHHDDHDEHGHEEHADDEHDHDDHGHDEHGHDDHAGDDHAAEEGAARHTEFHAEYTLTCDTPSALTQIEFDYFDIFPNALEVEVQIVTVSGAEAFEVERDAPVLNIGG